MEFVSLLLFIFQNFQICLYFKTFKWTESNTYSNVWTVCNQNYFDVWL